MLVSNSSTAVATTKVTIFFKPYMQCGRKTYWLYFCIYAAESQPLSPLQDQPLKSESTMFHSDNFNCLLIAIPLPLPLLSESVIHKAAAETFQKHIVWVLCSKHFTSLISFRVLVKIFPIFNKDLHGLSQKMILFSLANLSPMPFSRYIIPLAVFTLGFSHRLFLVPKICYPSFLYVHFSFYLLFVQISS